MTEKVTRPLACKVGGRALLIAILGLLVWSGSPAAVNAREVRSAARPMSVHKALRLCRQGNGNYRLTVEGYFVSRPQTFAELEGALADRLTQLPPDAQLRAHPWPPPGTLDVGVAMNLVMRSSALVPEHRLIRVRGLLECGLPLLEATKYPVLVKR